MSFSRSFARVEKLVSAERKQVKWEKAKRFSSQWQAKDAYDRNLHKTWHGFCSNRNPSTPLLAHFDLSCMISLFFSLNHYRFRCGSIVLLLSFSLRFTAVERTQCGQLLFLIVWYSTQSLCFVMDGVCCGQPMNRNTSIHMLALNEWTDNAFAKNHAKFHKILRTMPSIDINNLVKRN